MKKQKTKEEIENIYNFSRHFKPYEEKRGGKREGSGRKKKGSEKTKQFNRNIPISKYDLFCEVWLRWKKDVLKTK